MTLVKGTRWKLVLLMMTPQESLNYLRHVNILKAPIIAYIKIEFDIY